jgi:hypothetical protein
MGVNGRRKIGAPLGVGSRSVQAEGEKGGKLMCDEGKDYNRNEEYAFADLGLWPISRTTNKESNGRQLTFL